MLGKWMHQGESEEKAETKGQEESPEKKRNAWEQGLEGQRSWSGYMV